MNEKMLLELFLHLVRLETDSKPHFVVQKCDGGHFLGLHSDELKTYLKLSRGGVRVFKSLDALYKVLEPLWSRHGVQPFIVWDLVEVELPE